MALHDFAKKECLNLKLLSETELHNLHRVLRIVLDDLIQICNTNNLHFILIGGSAIGALRSCGFIPWDDDIDVAMPREDYEKFVHLKQNAFSDEKFFLQTFETDPHYMWNFAKLRDSSTTYIEHSFRNIRMNHGLWLDIFPLDGISKEPKDAKKLVHRIGWTWHNNYMMRMYAKRRKISKDTWLKDIFLNIYAYLFFWTNVGHWRNKLEEKRYLKYKTCECKQWVFYHSNSRTKGIVLRDWWAGEAVYGEFEGLKVRLPHNYDAYLSWAYGDYMTPPPENKRISLHPSKHCSATIGYKEYIKEHKL